MTACRLLIVFAATAACGVSDAQVPAFPSRAVRIVVPFAPGGGTDLIARPLAQRLGDAFGQQVVIENRPGANGIIGTESVVRAAPDGHTLVMSTNALTINPATQRKLPYDTLRDLTPVTMVASTQNLLTVHPSLPVRTVRTLIDLARARPGQIAFGSGGPPSHMAGEFFQQLADVKMIHVPYKGNGAALTDLVAGQIAVSFASMPSIIQYVRAGRLRALASCGATRVAALPGLPTVAESLPGYEAVLWFALLGPGAMPQEIVARLAAATARALEPAELRDRLAAQGFDLAVDGPQALAATLRTELVRWDAVVKKANLRPE